MGQTETEAHTNTIAHDHFTAHSPQGACVEVFALRHEQVNALVPRKHAFHIVHHHLVARE